jgi:hypothetical protein
MTCHIYRTVKRSIVVLPDCTTLRSQVYYSVKFCNILFGPRDSSVKITRVSAFACPHHSPLISYSAFDKSLCTYKRCWKWFPRASIQAWTRLILFSNTFCRSAFEQSLCTYKSCWKWFPRASIQAWPRLILFANTFCRSAFDKSLCTYKRCLKWYPRASIYAWTRLILFENTFCRSTFGKSLCTYKRRWKWYPRTSIQAETQIYVPEPKCTATFRTHCI